MLGRLLSLCMLVCLIAAPALAQNKPQSAAAVPAAAPMATAFSVSGKWTYRSYVNSPVLVDGDANRALQMIFGEGVFTFDTPTSNTLKGTLDMGGGFVLDVEGTVQPTAQGGARSRWKSLVLAALIRRLRAGSTTTTDISPTGGRTA